jgi:predicted DCC family thiol-disulfide oxidoreductase YuxK
MTSDQRAGATTNNVRPCPAKATGEILLVYDWECPVCNIYCRLLHVRPTAGRLRLVNARESTAVLQEITKAGLDIDQGMVAKMDGHLYYGSDAIHALALVGSRNDLFNRLTHYIFRSSQLSRVLYPCLRMCRNLLLKAMGKTKINNLKIEGNVRF